jgi:membrane protein
VQPKDFYELPKKAGQVWYEYGAHRLGVALAYYLAFALAPVLVIAVALASVVFGEAAAQGQLVKQIEATIGPQMAEVIQTILGQTHATGAGTLATTVSIAALLLSATAVFVEIQYGLDTLWDVRPKQSRGWLGLVKDRFWSLAVVLVVGALLLLSLTVSILMDMFFPSASLRAVNFIVSLGLITLLVATIYKILPDVVLAWRHVWVGSAATAVLFMLGKYLIGVYLSQVSLASAYGVAGSLAVILLWVYYSAQVFLFGAAFTKVYANRYGRPMVRTDRAEPLTRQERM